MEEKTQNPNVEPAKEMTEAELSELLQIRRDKLKALQDAGQDPFRKVRYDRQRGGQDDVQAHYGQGQLCPHIGL